jgi:hypothetical protein
MRRLTWIAGALLWSGLSCSTAKPMGAEGGSCYGNGTCNTSLVCLSSLCVDPLGDGGASRDGGGPGAPDASVGPASGSVDYTVTCGAAGCGQSGRLVVVAKACGAGGAAQRTDARPSTTLVAGAPITGTLTPVPAGDWCVSAYLDVNGSGAYDAGDVAMSPAEAAVTVSASVRASVAIELRDIVPSAGGAGSALLTWTVNGGQNCPSGAQVTTTTGPAGPAVPQPQQSACTTYSQQVDLAPGTYSFELALTDPNHPGQAAQATVSSVQVVSGQQASVGPVDLACSFCP